MPLSRAYYENELQNISQQCNDLMPTHLRAALREDIARAIAERLAKYIEHLDEYDQVLGRSGNREQYINAVNWLGTTLNNFLGVLAAQDLIQYDGPNFKLILENCLDAIRGFYEHIVKANKLTEAEMSGIDVGAFVARLKALLESSFNTSAKKDTCTDKASRIIDQVNYLLAIIDIHLLNPNHVLMLSDQHIEDLQRIYKAMQDVVGELKKANRSSHRKYLKSLQYCYEQLCERVEIHNKQCRAISYATAIAAQEGDEAGGEEARPILFNPERGQAVAAQRVLLDKKTKRNLVILLVGDAVLVGGGIALLAIPGAQFFGAVAIKKGVAGAAITVGGITALAGGAKTYSIIKVNERAHADRVLAGDVGLEERIAPPDDAPAVEIVDTFYQGLVARLAPAERTKIDASLNSGAVRINHETSIYRLFGMPEAVVDDNHREATVTLTDTAGGSGEAPGTAASLRYRGAVSL